MKLKGAFFPFTDQALPILRHFSLHNSEYEICEAISWSGLGVNNKDISFICNQPEAGISVKNMTDDCFSEWDVLIIDWDGTKNVDSQFDIVSWLRKYLCHGKNLVLISSQPDPLSSSEEAQSLHNDYSLKIKIICSDEVVSHRLVTSSEGFRPLRIPVILVGGLIKESSTLEILFSLKEDFEKNGHTVSCLCNNNSSILVGMHSYKHILAGEHGQSEPDKIASLNRLAHDITQTECPDIFLVEAPDAVMKYNYMAPNGFGVYTYMLVQALEPDFAVCCVPVDVAFKNFIDAIDQEFLKRYGCNIVGIHVSNYVIDSAGVRHDRTVSPVYVDTKLAHNAADQLKKDTLFPVFNVCTEGTSDLCRHLEKVYGGVG